MKAHLKLSAFDAWIAKELKKRRDKARKRQKERSKNKDIAYYLCMKYLDFTPGDAIWYAIRAIWYKAQTEQYIKELEETEKKRADVSLINSVLVEVSYKDTMQKLSDIKTHYGL